MEREIVQIFRTFSKWCFCLFVVIYAEINRKHAQTTLFFEANYIKNPKIIYLGYLKIDFKWMRIFKANDIKYLIKSCITRPISKFKSARFAKGHISLIVSFVTEENMSLKLLI